MGRPAGREFDARLFVRVQSELLDRAKRAAGDGDFGAWVREALEARLASGAHNNSQARKLVRTKTASTA